MGEVWSIGHSSHGVEHLLALLRRHEIDAVADVRSNPHSRHVPQFNAGALRGLLETNGIRYIFLGRELGGRPEGAQLYDRDGRVLYGKVAATPLFHQGIERLRKGMAEFRVAMLCAEENPSGCHRTLLIARVLDEMGISVGHIRGDGTIETERELRMQETLQGPQMALFEHAKIPEWKSIPSVLPRRQPNASLAS